MFTMSVLEIGSCIANTKSLLYIFQVASGMKQEKGSLLSPLMELTASKAVELFSEGLPAVIIQVAAAIFKGDISQMELFSLIISTVTCGFTSAQISYDFDTE